MQQQVRGVAGDESSSGSWERSRLPTHIGGILALGGPMVEHPLSDEEGGIDRGIVPPAHSRAHFCTFFIIYVFDRL